MKKIFGLLLSRRYRPGSFEKLKLALGMGSDNFAFASEAQEW